jgi:hypothetical protein
MKPYLRRPIDPQTPYRRWIDPRVRTLPLRSVIAYLSRRGWRQLPPDRKGFLAFQEPTGTTVDGRPLCQFVPDTEAYDNYVQLMFELLTGLAEFEDRQASAVLDDILAEVRPEQPNGAAVEQQHAANTAADPAS